MGEIDMSLLLEILYPIVWLTVIVLLDFINFLRHGRSLIRTYPKEFFGVILPLSALYWLYFEFVNLYFPQWHYVGITLGPFVRALMNFLSFATVIPIIIEIFWLFGGLVGLPSLVCAPDKTFKKFSPAFIFVGVVFLLLPIFSESFWLNQVMWFGPFFVFFPFVTCFWRLILVSWRTLWSFAAKIIATGLLSGLLWEFFNFWAGGKWEYLILPGAPRLFEMPLLGYLGFIPFALSTIAIYLFALRFLKPRWFVILPLYIFALLVSYLLFLA